MKLAVNANLLTHTRTSCCNMYPMYSFIHGWLLCFNACCCTPKLCCCCCSLRHFKRPTSTPASTWMLWLYREKLGLSLPTTRCAVVLCWKWKGQNVSAIHIVHSHNNPLHIMADWTVIPTFQKAHFNPSNLDTLGKQVLCCSVFLCGG